MKNRPKPLDLNEMPKDMLAVIISHFGLDNLINLTSVNKELNKFQADLITTKFQQERNKLQSAIKNDSNKKFSEIASEAIKLNYVKHLYYRDTVEEPANDDQKTFNKQLDKCIALHDLQKKDKEAELKFHANQIYNDIGSIIGQHYKPQSSILFANSNFDALYQLQELCSEIKFLSGRILLDAYSIIKTKLMYLAKNNKSQDLTYFYNYHTATFAGQRAFNLDINERKNFLFLLKNHMKQYPPHDDLPPKIAELKSIVSDYFHNYTSDHNSFKYFEDCANIISSIGPTDLIFKDDHFKELTRDLKKAIDTIHKRSEEIKSPPPPLPPRKKR